MRHGPWSGSVPARPSSSRGRLRACVFTKRAAPSSIGPGIGCGTGWASIGQPSMTGRWSRCCRRPSAFPATMRRAPTCRRRRFAGTLGTPAALRSCPGLRCACWSGGTRSGAIWAGADRSPWPSAAGVTARPGPSFCRIHHGATPAGCSETRGSRPTLSRFCGVRCGTPCRQPGQRGVRRASERLVRRSGQPFRAADAPRAATARAAP